MDFKIRIAQQSDSAELRDLYKNTVLVVNRRDYSQDEVKIGHHAEMIFPI